MQYLPKLVAGIVVLLVGWLLALLIARAIRAGVARSGLGQRLAHWLGEGDSQAIAIERRIGQVSYYVLLLLVLVGTFQTLGLMLVAQPLNQFVSTFFSFVPRIVGAAGLLLVAWIIATIVRFVVRKLFSIRNFGERLNEQAGIESERQSSLVNTIPETVYWVVFLLFLPGIVGALNIPGLMGPFSKMSSVVVTYLPHLLAATLIFAMGWFLARIIQRIVSNLLNAVGVDALGDRVGADRVVSQPISKLCGVIAYILVLIPVLIATLNALQLDYVTAPASHMLNITLAAIPRIFAALIIVVFAVVFGRLISHLIANLLSTVGFNMWVSRLRIGYDVERDNGDPAHFIGRLSFIAIVLISILESFQLLGFSLLANLASQLLVFAGHIAFGLFIIAIGLYIANWVAGVIQRGSSNQSALLSIVARVAVLVLAFAIGLRQMGVANQIISLAFGLTLGALAVAAAVAFGIGGRDIAHTWLSSWFDKGDEEHRDGEARGDDANGEGEKPE